MSVAEDLQVIAQARYGRDVRSAIVDAISDINEVANQAKEDATTAQDSASTYAETALEHERLAQGYAEQAQQYAEQAMSGTPVGYDNVVADVYSMKIGNSTRIVGTGSKKSKCLLLRMDGMSIQDGTPTPSFPVDISDSKANLNSHSKNLLPVDYNDSSKTDNGITFVVNTDGSITASGLATGNAAFNICARYGGVGSKIELENGLYKLSGCPNGGGNNKYRIQASVTKNTALSVIGNNDNSTPVIITVDGDDNSQTSANIGINIVVYSGTDLRSNPLVFYPMLTEADAEQTYEKSGGSNDVITDIVLRAMEVTSSDFYNLVLDGKYYLSDTLEKTESGYQVTRRIGIVELKNAISIVYSAANSPEGGYCYRFGFNNIFSKNATSNVFFKVLTNRFYGDKTSTTLKADIGRCLGTQQANTKALGVYITVGEEMTYESGIQWATDNPTYVYYPCDPTTEVVSDENVQKLLGIKSYDGTTYFEQIEDAEGVMNIEYPTSEMASKALSGYVIAEQNANKIHELNLAILNILAGDV